MATREWAWVALAAILGLSLCVDIYNTLPNGSIDLRNRITGARTMMANIPPYHYKWHKGDPPEYCDPYNNPSVPVSKVTATPTGLLFMVPYATLDYSSGQLLWLFTQWALLLGTVWFWLRRCKTFQQWLLIAALSAGFTYTASWRLHAEHGQAYVVLLFVFASWLVLTLDAKKGTGFLPGCVAGLLIALRPPLLLLVPFLALHRRGQLAGVAVGLLISMGLPTLINVAVWPDYFSAMHAYAGIYTSFIYIPTQGQTFPGTIEGISIYTLGQMAAIPWADFSVFNLLHALGFNSVPYLPVLLVIIAPFGLWLWLTRAHPVERLLPALAAWFFVIDLFLPSFRNSYNDVMILNIAALGLLGSARIPWGIWPCLLAVVAGWVVYGFNIHRAWMIDVPSFLFTLGAILFLWDEGLKEGRIRGSSPSEADQ